MSMRLYNSFTKTVETFKPINDKSVSMYVCGITPYDTTHLGHAFTYVVLDTLFRYLSFKGYNVTYVQNVTDIDDDILKKAKEQKKDWRELGDFWTKKFLLDMKMLNILPPTYYVKATDSITMMIRIIRVLLKKGLAYQKNGNVYFRTNKFASYGKLSTFTKEQMLLISKERGGNVDDPLKINPLDFILWQRSKEDEPYWESPWSKGRPGWHIECSAMINQYLGEQIDIHGGGKDLIFPHHESEIAQSESFSGKKPFVKYWIHTAMVMYKGEKMAKSLGNLVMVSDLLKKYSANAVRFVLLSHHYRAPWEFEEKELDLAEDVILTMRKNLSMGFNESVKNEFLGAMDNDLNIPLALSVLTKRQKVSREFVSLLGFSF